VIDEGFIEGIQLKVKEHGKEVLVNGKAQLILDDWRGELFQDNFKLEAEMFLRILNAGCAKVINEADNVLERKQQLVQPMDEKHGISPGFSRPLLDLLGLLLRGDTSKIAKTPEELKAEEEERINAKIEAKIKVEAEKAGRTAPIAQPVQALQQAPATPSIDSFMKRAKLFLEDSEWKQANDYFEKVLDVDPEYAPAYIGKLCVELQVRQEDLLWRCIKPIEESGSFQKALRFADAYHREILGEYNRKNQEHILEEKRQEAEKKRMLQEAKVKAEAEAKIRADYEAKLQVEAEAKLKAETEAKSKAAFERGIEHRNNEDYDKAIEEFTKVIKFDSNNAVAYSCRGDSYRMINEYDQAIADLNTAIILDKNDAVAYARRGEAYRGKEQYSQAIHDFNEAITLDPNFSFAYGSRGAAYCKIDQYDQAISDCNKALMLDPNYTFAYDIREEACRIKNQHHAQAYAARGKEYFAKGWYDQAINDYNEAIRLDQNYTEAYILRGEAYKMKGWYDQAISDYNRALHLDPYDSTAYNCRGGAYQMKGEYDRAISDYNMVLCIDPNNSPAYSCRGEAYRKKGWYDQAISDAQTALRLDPDNPIAKFVLENIYEG